MIKSLNRTRIAILLIIIISLLTLSSSFDLALFGDDWLVFYRYLKDLGPESSGPYNNFTFFFTPYGSFDLWMEFLRNFYQYNSTPYYITSYVLRLIATLSFYPILYYLTKNKLATFFGMLFFSITPVGLDTINWVFNMPSYITITFFNLFLYFFLRCKEEGKTKLLLLSGLFYYIAYVTVPIRMHGSLPLILILEFFWLSKNHDFKSFKKMILRLSFFILILLFIRFNGHSMGPPEETSYRLNLGLTTSLDLLKLNRFDFILHPLVTLGSLLVPENLLYIRQINTAKDLLLTILVPQFLIFILISKLILKTIQLFTNFFWHKILTFGLFWTTLVILIYKGNLNTFSSANYLILLSTGGYILFLVTALIYRNIKENNISNGLFLGLGWSILSFFFAWWWTPTSMFTTPHRYLIVSAVGITIILTIIFNMTLKQKNSLSILLFLFVILMHIFSTRTYLSHLVEIRGQKISNKIWSQISNFPKISFDKTPSLFYFESDGTNGDTLHDVITYGFPPHMGLLYNISNSSYLPTAIDNLEELSIAVSSGKNLTKFGYPEQPIPIDHIYAFKLIGRESFINITDQIRQKILSPNEKN
jgi:hypothetical protein